MKEPDKNKRHNMIFGVVLISIVSTPALTVLFGEFRRPAFSPGNSWLWLALLFLLAFGFAISTIGLLRKIHLGYFAWSQAILSLLVLMFYMGWYRQELDYAKPGPDPEAIDQGPPVATWQGFLFLVLTWLVPGFLPLALALLRRWRKARKSTSREQGASAAGGTKTPSAAADGDAPGHGRNIQPPLGRH